MPNQIATAYGLSPLYMGGSLGEGQTVALFEEDDYSYVNVVQGFGCLYEYRYNISSVTQVVNRTAPTLGSGEVEVELDGELALNMAPKLANLLVYETTNATATATALYQQIANDNLAKTVSTSWGNCEEEVNSYFRNAENAIFRQMAAQGQTFFDAIGDTGSQECLAVSGNTKVVADDIGSQPYVTGVGGTTLALDRTTNAIQRETVWNDYSLGRGIQ